MKNKLEYFWHGENNKTVTMKKFLLSLFLILIVVLNSSGQDKSATGWHKSAFIENHDKNTKIKFGGRIFYDIASISQDESLQDSLGGTEFGTEIRKARLFTSGQLYKNVKYKLQIGFSGGKVSLKDVWIELTKIPVIGSIRTGHFKEPMRLELQSSSKYTLAMERSFVTEMLPERNTGIMLHNEFLNKKIGVQAGAFFNAGSTGNNKHNNGYMNIDGRIVFVPVNNEKTTLHFASYYSYRANEEKKFEWEFKPEAHLAPNYISLQLNAGNMNVFGGELGTAWKQITFYGEYMTQYINATANDYNFNAYTLNLGYFITGEHRHYKNTVSGFGGISPKKNFGNRGFGALEVVTRFSSVNLNNKDLNAGEINNFTIGLNWYLNPTSRLMINYILTDRKGIGKANIIEFRTQVSF